MKKKNRSRFKNGNSDYSQRNNVPEYSQEDLNEYIRVSRPSVLVVIFSLLLILIAVIVWGFVGTLPVTETVTGIVVDTDRFRTGYSGTEDPETLGKITSHLSEESRVQVFFFLDASRYNGETLGKIGEEAVIRLPDQHTVNGKIESSLTTPVSLDTLSSLFMDNQWELEQCVTNQDYSWWMTIIPSEDLSSYLYSLAEITIVTEEVRPIQFLIGK